MQKISRIYNFDVIGFALCLLLCIIILIGNFATPDFNKKLAMSIKIPANGIKYYFTQGIFIQYQTFLANQDIIKSLQQENNALQKKLSLSAIHSFNNIALQKDIQELSQFLNLNTRPNIKIMGTFPVALSTTNFLYHTFSIKLKSGDHNNIRVNKLVVSKNMAIGYVSKLYYGYADVLTILDSNFKISAFSEQSKINLIVIGNGTYYPDITLYSDNQDLKEGEIIYTSGLEGNFPRYIPLGILVKRKNKWQVSVDKKMFDVHYILILQ